MNCSAGKRIGFSWLVVCIACAALLLAGCSSSAPSGSGRDAGGGRAEGETYQILYDERMAHIMGHATVQDLADALDPEEYLSDDADGFTDYGINGDGILVVTYSSAQCAYREERLREKVESTCENFPTRREGCSLEVSDDWKVIDCTLTPEAANAVSAATTGSILQALQMDCAQLQLFEHPGDPSFVVTINFYNADTGQLVATGGTEAGDVSWTPEDWGLPAGWGASATSEEAA